MADAQSGANALSLEPLFFEASDPAKFKSLFEEAFHQGVNGLAGMASPFLNFHRKRLITLANNRGLPSIWEAAAYVRDGACYLMDQASPKCTANRPLTSPRF